MKLLRFGNGKLFHPTLYWACDARIKVVKCSPVNFIHILQWTWKKIFHKIKQLNTFKTRCISVAVYVRALSENPLQHANLEVLPLSKGHQLQWLTSLVVKHMWQHLQLSGATGFKLCYQHYPDSRVHGPTRGPSGRQDPGGPHVGPMNFAIWVHTTKFGPIPLITVFMLIITSVCAFLFITVTECWYMLYLHPPGLYLKQPWWIWLCKWKPQNHP